MKLIYEVPEMEILKFRTEDIVVTSGSSGTVNGSSTGMVNGGENGDGDHFNFGDWISGMN